MGTTCSYKPSHVSAFDYLKSQGHFTWSGEEHTYADVDHSTVGSVLYVAIKRTNKTSGDVSVFALVVKTSSNAKEHYNFCYKDVCEDMGPVYVDCPARILDQLTPTDDKYALEWRKSCRDRLSSGKLKRKILAAIKPGCRVIFSQPKKLANGALSSRFRCLDPKARLFWSEELMVNVKFRPDTLSDLDAFEIPGVWPEPPTDQPPADKKLAFMQTVNLCLSF